MDSNFRVKFCENHQLFRHGYTQVSAIIFLQQQKRAMYVRVAPLPESENFSGLLPSTHLEGQIGWSVGEPEAPSNLQCTEGTLVDDISSFFALSLLRTFHFPERYVRISRKISRNKERKIRELLRLTLVLVLTCEGVLVCNHSNFRNIFSFLTRECLYVYLLSSDAIFLYRMNYFYILYCV